MMMMMMMMMMIMVMVTTMASTMAKLIQVFRADYSSHIQFVGVEVPCTVYFIYEQLNFTVMLRFTVFVCLVIYALFNSTVGSSDNQTLSYLRHKLTTIFGETYCEWRFLNLFLK
jgi:hypothetical protein